MNLDQHLLDQLHALQVQFVALPAEEALALAEIRHETRLRMPDAIVVHTARLVGANLVTADKALANAAQAFGIVSHAPEQTKT
jgi:predicted nucleic acid-binding protein